MLSDPLNDRLPKWLHFGGEYRARVEGFTSGGFKPNNDDAYFLSRLRLSLTVQPESWLKFSFQGQDAHVFWKNQNPPAPPFQDAMVCAWGIWNWATSKRCALAYAWVARRWYLATSG